MKLTDFLAEKLKENQINNVYGLTGGAVVHIFDSIHKKNINITFTNHEQAAAFAAVGNSKLTNNNSCCIVTTGPGVTNTITGLAGAWLDSVPVIFISGQSRLSQTTNNLKNIRQVGTQQLNVIPIVESITKYSVMLEDPKLIRYEIEKCFHLSKSGRPGPVWIDIPIDLQWVDINPLKLESYYDSEEYFIEKKQRELTKIEKYNNNFQKLFSLISKSKYPLFLLGNGVRLSNSISRVKKIIDFFKIPFVTTWLASDIYRFDEKLNVGRVGLAGQRGANIAIQNTDLLIIVGCHLPIPVTGSKTDLFSRDSKKIIINIDKDEIKFKKDFYEVIFDLDVGLFCERFNELYLKKTKSIRPKWEKWIDHVNRLNFFNFKYTLDLINKTNNSFINQYLFINELSISLNKYDKIVIDGGGTNVYITFQAFKNKEFQRFILTTSLCSMGSGIPEAIGVHNAKKNGEVYCLVGDGSFYLNMQELKTIQENNLKIKIIVFNNGGYRSIKDTQRDFLEENYIGTSSNDQTNIKKLTEAFGINYFSLKNPNLLKTTVSKFITEKSASILEVYIDPNQKIIPSQYFKKENDIYEVQPLENMYPPLEESIMESLIINSNIKK